jgi:hypothetical protein
MASLLVLGWDRRAAGEEGFRGTGARPSEEAGPTAPNGTIGGSRHGSMVGASHRRVIRVGY